MAAATAVSFLLLLGPAAHASVLDIQVVTWEGDVLAGADIFVPAAKMTTDEFAQKGTPSGGGVSWWDIEIQVTRSTDAPTSEDIELEMDVFNQTGIHWDDFHITLGTGTGATFTESDELDQLFFTNAPPPATIFDMFPDPPMTDEVLDPDSLWWAGLPGIDSPGNEIFEVGVHVPVGFFENSVALFTVRKHATAPEPSALVLLSLGLAGLGVARLTRAGRT